MAKIGHKHFKKNLLDKNNIDVFMHCWDTQFKDELVSLYKPKGYIFQKQINFGKGLTTRQFAIKSYWYSVKKVFNVVKQYEKKHNFEYD